MITHIRYEEERFKNANACNDAVRDRIDRGWTVSRVDGLPGGNYVVIFRLDTPESAMPQTATAASERTTGPRPASRTRRRPVARVRQRLHSFMTRRAGHGFGGRG